MRSSPKWKVVDTAWIKAQRFSFKFIKRSTAKPSRFPRFPGSLPEGGAPGMCSSVPYTYGSAGVAEPALCFSDPT